MTFSDFLSAVRSAWGWFNNAGILLAVLAGVGVNAVCTEVPTWLAVALCVVAYVAGFLAACYRASSGASDRPTQERTEGQASRIAELEGEVERLRGQLQTRRVPGAVAGLRAMAAASSTSTVAPGEDPLAELVPAEVPFLLSVYDGAQAHVGTENLMVARSLRRKGVVYRTDAPESDVISQCDVALTDDWVRIMNERADELR